GCGRADVRNPAGMHRLMPVEALVVDPGFVGMASAEIKRRLDEIRAEAPATTSGLRRTGHSGAEGGGDGMSGGRAPGGHGAAGGEAPSGEGAAGRGPAESARLGPTALPEGAAAAGLGAGRDRPAESARLVQTVLREVASAAEIEAAADLLAERFPDLAEVLRVYGAGRASEAEAHFVRTILRHA